MGYVDKTTTRGVTYALRDSSAVPFDRATSLTELQKSQARTNIGAAKDVDVDNIEAAIGDTYSPPYNYGDYIYYDGAFRMAAQDIPATETTFVSGHWSVVNMIDEFGHCIPYDKQIWISSAQQLQAANNMGVLRTAWGQTLTEDQKQAVRYAIGLDLYDWDVSLTDAQKQQFRKNIDAAEAPPITPEMYGAKGDGVTDDTYAVRYAFAAAQETGVPVVLGYGKTYLVDAEIDITKRIAVFGNGATLKATANNTAHIFYINEAETQFPATKGKGLIENLTLDCNGCANYAIFVRTIGGLELQNLDICGFNQVGIYMIGGFEIFCRNIRIAGTDDPDTVGIEMWTHDSSFVDIVTKNVGTGIHNVGQDNYFCRVHSWNDNAAITPTSVMFDCESDATLTDCCADTVATAVKITNTPNITVINMTVLHGGSGTGGYMTPAIMGNVVPVVFDVPSLAAAANIRSFGMNYLSPTETYRMFSIDPGNIVFVFDWGTNNAVSVQSMNYFPKCVSIPAPPTTDGTYNLRVTVSGGAPTFSWVSI